MIALRRSFLAGLLAALACGGGGSSPTDPGSPLPVGIANSTAFQNLPLILSLQEARHPGTMLVKIAGPTDFNGRVLLGDGWGFQFADLANRRYGWTAHSNGLIEYHGETPAIDRVDLVDIRSQLAIDSPEIARLGLQFGGEEYRQRYPDTIVGIGYRFLGGEPIAKLVFSSFIAFPGCQVEIFVHAQTGALMARQIPDWNEPPCAPH